MNLLQSVKMNRNKESHMRQITLLTLILVAGCAGQRKNSAVVREQIPLNLVTFKDGSVATSPKRIPFPKPTTLTPAIIREWVFDNTVAPSTPFAPHKPSAGALLIIVLALAAALNYSIRAELAECRKKGKRSR